MANVGARKGIRSAASYEGLDFLRLLRFFAANPQLPSARTVGDLFETLAELLQENRR
jgi:hypothetical protein